VLPREVFMDLVFYRLPYDLVQDIDISKLKIFFYNEVENKREIILDMQTIKPESGYLQILKTESEELPAEYLAKILEFNQSLIDYVDFYNRRVKTYAPFMKNNWMPLIEIRQALKDNDFNILMGIIQAELACDPQDISNYASTVSESIEKLLRRDSKISRMICFSFCCYKMLQYDDRELLYDFLGALIFKDLGLSQNNPKDIWEKNDLYFKHPYYTLFLLKKMPIELSKRTYFFILDHHENQDGSGFSRQKVGANYHPLCDILKITEQIFVGKKSTTEYKQILQKIIQSDHSSLIQATLDCLSSILTGLND
jgi:hypothetical protein